MGGTRIRNPMLSLDTFFCLFGQGDASRHVLVMQAVVNPGLTGDAIPGDFGPVSKGSVRHLLAEARPTSSALVRHRRAALALS
jgi:hypothetical protein